jgi:hypothetical protein
MKRHIPKILLATILLQVTAQFVHAVPPEGATKRLSLAVVFDSSQTRGDTWQRLKLSACQVIDSLQQDDNVEILRARDGEPALHSDSLIQSPSVSDRENLRQCIWDIRQVSFPSGRADVAKAIATA